MVASFTPRRRWRRNLSEPAPITQSSRASALSWLSTATARSFSHGSTARPASRQSQGESYTGAAPAFAWADAGNAAVGETRLVVDNTCECCRIAVTFAERGKPVIVFRNIFEGSIRDHAVTAFTDPLTPGPVKRVSVDNWKTRPAPIKGQASASRQAANITSRGTRRDRPGKGMFYASSTDAGEHFLRHLLWATAMLRQGPLVSPRAKTSRSLGKSSMEREQVLRAIIFG